MEAVLQLANLGKLKMSDLGMLVTFGQYMYAGMKEEHGVDLNKAVVGRTAKTIVKEMAPLGQDDSFPWGIPPPRQCTACSGVVAEDLDPGGLRRPWNRPAYTLFDRQEKGYVPGGSNRFVPNPPKHGVTMCGKPWL